MTGEVLGPYRLLRKLGAGGMGVVFVARHELLGHEVAIKLLLPQLSRDADVVRRFFDEARASSLVQHPAIVRIFDFGRAPDGAAYFVMEMLAGDSLAGRLKQRQGAPMALEMVAAIGRQIANALAAAHAAGIVHRDLKPDNVFLQTDATARDGERVKILDFGIAKLADELRGNDLRTQSGTLMGTPLYMAPEQCRGAETASDRTDVYALGCILYEMVCGRAPFVFGSLAEVLAAHQHEPVPEPRVLRPELPAAWAGLIMACLAKEPARRPSMLEVAAALQGPSGQQAVAVPVAMSVPVRVQEPGRPPVVVRKRPMGLMAAGAAAVVVVAGLLVWKNTSTITSTSTSTSTTPSTSTSTSPSTSPSPSPSVVQTIVTPSPSPSPSPSPIALAPDAGTSLGRILVTARVDHDDDYAWAYPHLTAGLKGYGLDIVDKGPADGSIKATCNSTGNGLLYRGGTSYGEIEGSRVRCQVEAKVGRFRTSFALSGSTPRSVYGEGVHEAAFSVAFSSYRVDTLAPMAALALGHPRAARDLVVRSLGMGKSASYVDNFLRDMQVSLDAPELQAYLLVRRGKFADAAALGTPALEALGTVSRGLADDDRQFGAVLAAIIQVGGPDAARLVVDLLNKRPPKGERDYPTPGAPGTTIQLLEALAKVGGPEHVPFLETYVADQRPEVSAAAKATQQRLEAPAP